MERKEGYYWVKCEGEWIIAEFFITESNGGYVGWYLFGTHEPEYWNCPHFQDSAFSEINENRLPMPDEEIGIAQGLITSMLEAGIDCDFKLEYQGRKYKFSLDFE